MKAKILTYTVVAACMLGSIAFGQTLTIAGSVCACDSKRITVPTRNPLLDSSADT